jgi:hypothetical protein
MMKAFEVCKDKDQFPLPDTKDLLISLLPQPQPRSQYSQIPKKKVPSQENEERGFNQIGFVIFDNGRPKTHHHPSVSVASLPQYFHLPRQSQETGTGKNKALFSSPSISYSLFT